MLRMALFRLKPLQFGKTLSAPPGVQLYASSISHLRSFSTPAIVNDDRPLAGIKVVDLTRILAGPFATMMLVSIPTVTQNLQTNMKRPLTEHMDNDLQSDLGGKSQFSLNR